MKKPEQIADAIIDSYREHYGFDSHQAKSHLHDCIVNEIDKEYGRRGIDESISLLMDAWVNVNGILPWAKAVEIIATLNKLGPEEKQRLLALDD